MLAAHKTMKAAMAARASAASANGAASNGKPPAPRGIFTTLRGGLQQLVDAITAKLDARAIRLNTAVTALQRTEDGWRVTSDGVTERYDGVIAASPAWAAGSLLGTVDAQLGQDLEAIPYSSSITVNMIFNEQELGQLPDGFGFLVPASSGRAMLACTFVHRKFIGRTAPGKAVLRAFLGGINQEAMMDEPDNVLIATVRRELSEILGRRVIGPHIEPEHTQVNRWRRSMAQYAVGHQERMRRINESVASLPGLALAGNAYDGIGIPDCIRLGRQAVKRMIAARVPAHVTR
jgi:oxygen-dependent protoporphyrinogen oxidase